MAAYPAAADPSWLPIVIGGAFVFLGGSSRYCLLSYKVVGEQVVGDGRIRVIGGRPVEGSSRYHFAALPDSPPRLLPALRPGEVGSTAPHPLRLVFEATATTCGSFPWDPLPCPVRPCRSFVVLHELLLALQHELRESAPYEYAPRCPASQQTRLLGCCGSCETEGAVS